MMKKSPRLTANTQKGTEVFILSLVLFLVFLTGFSFAEKAATFPDLKRPRDIIIDGNRVFISDFPHIYIYSFKDFSLIKKLGKEGAGPGEFQYTNVFQISVNNHYLFAYSQRKVSYFTKDGDLKKEMNTGTAGHSFKILENLNIIGGRTIIEGTKRYRTIVLLDANLEPLKELSRVKHAIQAGNTGVPVFDRSFNIEVSKDRVFTTLDNDFIIKVFNHNGELLHTIEMEDKKNRPRVTGEHKKALHQYLKLTFRGYPAVKDRMVFPEYFPALRSHGVKHDYNNGNQKLYAATWNKRDHKTECFVFNIEGKFLRKVYLPLKEKSVTHFFPFTIKDGKLYQLSENEESEEFELHVTGIK